MPPRVNSQPSEPAVLAAVVLGLFWCVEGIDVNAPQVDRVVLLLIVMLPLLLARWTTQPYYVYVGAIAACGVALLATRIDSE